MKSSILRLKLRGKRDVLRARQRTRQIARLLGYEFLEQSWIAACVFEMTGNAIQSGPRANLVIHLNENRLRIEVEPRSHARRGNAGLRRSASKRGLLKILPPLSGPTQSVSAGIPTRSVGTRWGKNRRLAFPLPSQPLTVDRNDLPWMIQQLNRLTPLLLFEEFRQQNLEILHLSSLLGCRLDGGEKGSSAA